MGEVFFSIDLELLKVLKGLLPLEIFVETGTFQGNTTAILANMFGCVHTVNDQKNYLLRQGKSWLGNLMSNCIMGHRRPF